MLASTLASGDPASTKHQLYTKRVDSLCICPKAKEGKLVGVIGALKKCKKAQQNLAILSFQRRENRQLSKAVDSLLPEKDPSTSR